MGAGAAAFQIDPDVVTDIATDPIGLWVPAPASGEIVHIDAASARVTARVGVSDPGALLDVEERDAGVIVLDRTAGRVTLVDPALHEVVREVGGLPVDGNRFDIGPSTVITADRDRVALVDLQVTGSQIVSIDAPVRSVAADGDGAIVDNGLERFAVDPDGEVAPGTATTGHVVRVVDRVVALRGDEVRSLGGSELGCFENNLSGPDVAIGTSDEWVVALDGSNLHVADLVDGDCVVIRLGDDVGALGRPVVAGRRVFIPETATGAVYAIDPNQRSVNRISVLTPGFMRLRARADMVVAYDAVGTLAALIDEEGVVAFVPTAAGDRGIVVTDDADTAVVGGDSDAPAVAVPGVDADLAAEGAPVIDANVLAATVQDQPDDPPDPLPDDQLVANFSFSATTVTVGELVRFVDSSTGDPEAWRWDFGDGTGGEGPTVEKAWDEPGTYPVTLTVERGDEEKAISLAITVVPAEVSLPPAADFVFSSTVVEVGDEIDFEDRSDGDIERWRWDFGDGATAFTPDASHAWSTPGRYTVQLTVANDEGSDRARVEIEVIAGLRAPEAVLVASETDVDLGERVEFTGSSTTDPAKFDWDFGDGTTASGAEPVHVYLQTGTFTVTLTARNDAGTSTAQTVIVVSPPTLPPTAVIGTLPAIIEVGDLVELTSLSTNSPDTEVWSFGDGMTGSGNTVRHAWNEVGSYLLTLTATNAAGTNSVTETIVVVAELPPPVAQIGDFDPSPWVNETTLFLDASIDATSWQWDFGDGSTSTSINPLHTFTTPGQKIVTLTVSNRNGSNSTSVIVEPRLEPIARFEMSASAVRTGETVEFYDRSDNAVSWAWTFGDGATSSAQNPLHTYTSTGAWPVTLTVHNGAGDSSSFTRTVFVNPARPRIASVDLDAGDDDVVTTLEDVTFTAVVDASSGPIDGYEIDFGDGSGVFGSTSPSFGHDYDAAGSYTVKMRAHGGLNEWSEWVSLPVTVVNPPPPSVAIADFADPQEVGSISFTGVDVGGGPIAAWNWQIRKDGGLIAEYSGKTTPPHFFGAEGDYTITLTAESPVAAVADHQVVKPLHINPPPPPSIDKLEATPNPATTGVLVQFPVEVSGAVEEWWWNYGDGWERGDENGQTIFNTVGGKTVGLRIVDAFDQQVVETVDLVVNPGPDIDPIVVSPPSPVPTGTVVGLSSNDPLGLPGLTWDWRVYPTGSSPPATPTYANAGDAINHPFTVAGDWTVSVTARDPNGVSDTKIAFVTVEEPLVAGFGHSQTGLLEISFTDTSSGPPVDNWSWDFGSAGAVGVTSVPNPVVTYPAPGSYTVTLTVWSGAKFDSVSATITVS